MQEGSAASLRLTFSSGARSGETVEVAGESFHIGREPGCDLILSDERVSRRHARVTRDSPSRFVLTDLHSANGTFVGAERLHGSRELTGGESIRVGLTTLEVVMQAPATAPTVAMLRHPRRSGQTTVMRALEGRVRRTTVLAAGAVLAALSALAVALATGALDDDEVGVPPTAAGTSVSTAEIVRAAKQSTVLVASSLGGRAIGSGSGWTLDADEGLVVTNAHVVNLQPDAGRSSLEVVAAGRPRAAEVVGMAPCEDLALLRVRDTEDLHSLPLGSQDELEQGATVVALGFPRTASSTPNLVATRGVVSVVRARADAATGTGVVKLENVVQTDAAINAGSSGGPLVDERMRLVGVNTLKRATADSQGYAIGVDHVVEVLETLRRGKSIGWTGAAFTPLTAQAGMPGGLLLAAAVSGSEAARAGLGRSLKLLRAVDGRSIKPSVSGYCAALGNGRSGKQVTLSVQDVGRTASGAYVLRSAVPEDVRVTLE